MKKKVSGFLAASGEAKGWRDIPEGGLIIQAGNSEEYYTGGWRTFKPLVDKKRCINCLQCWIMCPDTSIYAEKGNMEGFDYDHCKGCQICAEICPVKCIKMVMETEPTPDFDERGRTTKVQINEKK
ncbi:MAG: 4Fe-4S dicluster-binding protein [Candidatus Woesearchaeota archaeon]